MKLQFDVDPKTLAWEYDLQFCGQTAAHCFYVYHIISRVLKMYPVKSIIEIGTQRGALTAYLGLWGARLGVPVYSFDIEPALHRDIDPVLDKLGVQTYDMDVFSEAGLVEIQSLAKGPVYLICDGGDKEREFATFAPMLEVGSVVSVHDWGTEVRNLTGVQMFQFEGDDWSAHDSRFATVEIIGKL